MTVHEVLARLHSAKPAGDKRWRAKCPAHRDEIPSLMILEGRDGRSLLKCYAGCTTQEIVAAMGLEIRDLFMESGPTTPRQDRETAKPTGQPYPAKPASVPAQPAGAPEAVYNYRDEHGVVVAEKRRYPGKRFAWFRPDGQGNWLLGRSDVRVPLYRIDQIRRSGSSDLIIVEGERDADRLWGCGHPATTGPDGAQSWRPEYAASIKAAAFESVFVIPDNDDPGRKYAEDVAASCHAAGLKVKIATLPGLQEHEDVSDYLDRHAVPELLALALQAPEWKPGLSALTKGAFSLTTLGELMARPTTTMEWLWDGLIASSTLADIVGKPKSGKSTLQRCLCLAVSRGEQFLGRDTTQGTVWYVALEEREQDVKDHFKALGAAGDEPIFFFIGQAPPDIVPRMRELATAQRPALIVIDPMQRFLKLKDISDYAEQSNRFDPILAIARDTSAAIFFSHHAPKGEREDVDAGLGSIGIVGSVHTHMVLRRTEKHRTLSTIQRSGTDLEPTVLEMDPATKWVTAGLTRAQADEAEAEAAVLGVLDSASGPIGEPDIRERATVRTGLVAKALRVLRDHGKVARTGAGRKGDPYLYAAAADSRSLVPDIGRERENENQNSEVRADEMGLDARSGLFAD